MARASDGARSRDPDAEPGRPRLAVVGGDLDARALWRELGDDASLARFDLVLVAAGSVSGLGVFDGAFTRAKGPGGAVLAGGFAEAALLAREGKVDGVAGACGDEPAEVAPILVRGERRVLAFSATAREADLERLPAMLALASRGLREIGVARPGLALCATDDVDASAAAEKARALGVDLLGPVPAEEAFAASRDLVVTLTRDQARLGLLLAGTEPTARLLLGLPYLRTSADPAERGAATLRASVVLAARVARARGELVSVREEREAERKRASLASLAVSARAAREDRCPYCRRAFSEEEPVVRCARCETPHHRACVHEHGRCTVHGCGAGEVSLGSVHVPIARLGADPSVRIAFSRTLGGEKETDPPALWIEPPIDDPEVPSRRGLAIELDAKDVVRAGRVEGAFVVHAPRPLRAAGGVFRLRATLEVRGRDERPRVQPIVEREAVVAGDPGRGLLLRLSDGILGTGDQLAIPAGTRRWRFAFRLPPDHPATVENKGPGGQVEVVTTRVEATLQLAHGALEAAAALHVG
jgi:hypothetical protein